MDSNRLRAALSLRGVGGKIRFPPNSPKNPVTPSETLERYKLRYRRQRTFFMHACDGVATVLLRPETGAV